MTNEEWYRYVPLDEHSSSHRYCDPVLCLAWVDELDKWRHRMARESLGEET